MTEDLLYPYGGACFSVYSEKSSSGNDTVINCNGHTVYASRGGTFANIANASGVTVENCYLANFTTAIFAGGVYENLVNNTVLNTGTAISLANSHFTKVALNKMENDTSGVVSANTNYANIINNLFYGTSNAIVVSGGSSAAIENNTASRGVYGMRLSNTSSAILMNNLLLNMSASGLYCTGSSATNSATNRDYGGNVCSGGNRNCTWMVSPGCAPQ